MYSPLISFSFPLPEETGAYSGLSYIPCYLHIINLQPCLTFPEGFTKNWTNMNGFCFTGGLDYAGKRKKRVNSLLKSTVHLKMSSPTPKICIKTALPCFSCIRCYWCSKPVTGARSAVPADANFSCATLLTEKPPPENPEPLKACLFP